MAIPTHKKINSLKPRWALWLFPVIALTICGWLIYDHQQKLGPVITISLDEASGLQAQKTRVRFRGVDIGYVKKIVISEDTKSAVVTIPLQKEAIQFATAGTKFWVVSPKVTFAGISGLETLLEGTYIAATPGPEGAQVKTEFDISLNSQSTDSLENTSAYFLESPNVESVSVNDSVTFRGIIIGHVTKVSLSKTSQTVLVQINVQNKYVKLIRTNTIFWLKVGIQADLGLFGSKVRINSLDSIMRGGVDLFTPDPAGEKAKAGAQFNLASAPPKGYEKWNPVLD